MKSEFYKNFHRYRYFSRYFYEIEVLIFSSIPIFSSLMTPSERQSKGYFGHLTCDTFFPTPLPRSFMSSSPIQSSYPTLASPS